MDKVQDRVTIGTCPKPGRRGRIDLAAACLGRGFPSFALNAACRQPQDVLRDRTDFALGAKGSDASVAKFGRLLALPDGLRHPQDPLRALDDPAPPMPLPVRIPQRLLVQLARGQPGQGVGEVD